MSEPITITNEQARIIGMEIGKAAGKAIADRFSAALFGSAFVYDWLDVKDRFGVPRLERLGEAIGRGKSLAEQAHR